MVGLSDSLKTCHLAIKTFVHAQTFDRCVSKEAWPNSWYACPGYRPVLGYGFMSVVPKPSPRKRGYVQHSSRENEFCIRIKNDSQTKAPLSRWVPRMQLIIIFHSFPFLAPAGEYESNDPEVGKCGYAACLCDSELLRCFKQFRNVLDLDTYAGWRTRNPRKCPIPCKF